MPKLVLLKLLFLLLYAGSSHAISSFSFQEGDLIFQTSLSSQSQAIQLATKSPYSHVGMIIKKSDQFVVIEAHSGVELTEIKTWIARGKNQHYVVLRPKISLNPAQKEKLRKIALSFLNKKYDSYFEWSDTKIYCSELIWKAYHRALKTQLSQVENLKDFDLSHPIVKAKMKQRFGSKIPQWEKVVSPKALFKSEKLIKIYESKL